MAERLPADTVYDELFTKLRSIRGNRDYDKGWRDALDWAIWTLAAYRAARNDGEDRG